MASLWGGRYEKGIVTEAERVQIIAGLGSIRQDIAGGKIVFTVEDEDIHMGIESRLTARIRNDQCQVDARLYLKKAICGILNSLCCPESVILEKAEKYADKITAGRARPESLAQQ